MDATLLYTAVVAEEEEATKAPRGTIHQPRRRKKKEGKSLIEKGREGGRPLLPALCQRGLSILSLPPNGELKSKARSEGKRERPSSLMAGKKED